MRRSAVVGIAAAVSLALGAGGWVVAQQPAEDTPTLTLDVDLVNLFFSVRDKRGGLVANLEKDQFQLFEDGKPQEIKQFTRETDLPLTLGVLIDVSRSQENLIATEKRAGERFFQSVLRDKDMGSLMSFGSDVELLQDSTSSVKLLASGLDGLRVVAQPHGIHPGPVPTAVRQKGTVLYDAVYLAAEEKMRREVGRKALVLITDGMDYGSRMSLEDAIASTHKADTMIYSIYYSDPSFYPGSDSALKKMSEQTGGRVFHVGRRNTLDDIFKQIQEEMRSQYTLAYTPTNSSRDGGFRKIDLKTKSGEYKVQARKGYFATKTGS